MTLGHESLDVYRLSIGCVAIQDVLVVGKALDRAEGWSRKDEHDRMAAMLSRLGGRGYQVHEDPVVYGDTCGDFDSDPDSDFDLDAEQQEPQPRAPGGA